MFKLFTKRNVFLAGVTTAAGLGYSVAPSQGNTSHQKKEPSVKSDELSPEQIKREIVGGRREIVVGKGEIETFLPRGEFSKGC